MSVEIPFVKDFEFEYGDVASVRPNVRRVICRNPGAFTFTGTGTYILGSGEVAVIDPGPLDTSHLNAILQALKGESITHILITHTHMDHSPLARELQKHCDAKTYGFGPHGSRLDDPVKVEEGGDQAFQPDVTVRHGDVIEGKNWQVECVHTPGHTSNHICYQLAQTNSLFSGDHVMGWSTSVISPPDGNMGDYMRSLNLLLDREDQEYWPTHGTVIDSPKAHVQAFIAHRQEREDQILAQVKRGNHEISAMVPDMYRAVGSHLWPAASRSVFAAVLHLVEQGKLRCDGEPSISSAYY
ncbi:MAG: MBL fold metallo-hydrolase [Gammaproteobacteria bacterium]|nr:MBL fold metallo-hydrolase [Gammaproteobacteria bacterium]